jgi:serine protease DegQ
MRRTPTAAALGALALAAGVAAGCGATRTVTVTQTVTTRVPAATAPARRAGSDTFDEIPGIVERVSPSIVSIFATSSQGESEGSGVIWSASGTIVTNNHVVEGAARVEVVLASGDRVAARIRARDPLYDLAVVTVDRTGLPAATFAQQLPEVGELAIAMGSPLGLANTVTAGIISALHRSIPSGGQTPALVDLLQTDAAISPGNSGGALVNAQGRVVGINVAYIPPQQQAVSIGFAIPAPTVVDDVRELIRNGRATHAFLGVTPAEITSDMAQRFQLSTGRGALVLEVVAGSAASGAGLRAGDVIVALGGRRVATVEDLFAALRAHIPGDRVTVTVVRAGKRRTVTATLRGRSSS